MVAPATLVARVYIDADNNIKEQLNEMNLILYAVPFFLLAIAFELAWGWHTGNRTYRLNDTVSSLMLGNLSQARKFIMIGVGGAVYQATTAYFSLSLWDATAPLTWIVAFVLYDFCYYWLHRLGHERQILWAAHVAHHQSEEYNLSTALRQTSSGFLLGWVFYVPMFMLGIPAEVVVTVGAANLMYQFWVHTRYIPSLGWYEWFFVSPSNHRVHHAQNDQYMDRNYGGVFILWDRLFGTYQRELTEAPCIYGIRGPIESWNPLVALTHVYRDMTNDMLRTGSWSSRFQVLTARTGWQPADVVKTHPRLKNDLSVFQKYDPVVGGWIKFYAALNLVLMTGLSLFGQVQIMSTGSALGWQLIGLMLWTGVSIAWALEGKYSRAFWLLDVGRMVMLGVFSFKVFVV